ncbi:MAG: Holliday junction branch migration protein RuvA [Tannerella sp.]|jgi:Holliday junction DNA helicase RuvA|nr:Holliday junction branch migration protein RuvA [Tannerella sp.]
MIEYIKGEIEELSPTQLTMECNGIGYGLNISLTTYGAFNGQKKGKIYVYEVIREDAHLLYGFATREERELFLLLTSVSGVGPNTARMILSSLPPAELINVIASGDDASLTSVKGIGSKTAQRIVVDLRNKVKQVESMDETGKLTPGVRSKTAEGAVAALIMLGFQKTTSQKAVDSLLKKSPSASVEQVIKDALKML